MKRVLDNLHVDLITAALMVAMVATGYILRFPLPPGSNKSLILWGLTRHQWGGIHFWISLGLLVLVAVHVYLHWQWIVVTVKRRFWGKTSPSKSSLASGLLTVLALTAGLVLFGWAAQSSVRAISEPIEGVCPPTDTGDQVGTVGSGDARSADATSATDQSVAFWKDVYPIFEKSCLPCHGAKMQTSGFRVDQKEDFFEEHGKTPFVVPGKSKDSPLIAILSGERKDMARADVHRLAEEELAIVTAWIDAGAEWPERPAN
jgi:uncharacterized membrane protein